MKDRYNVLNLVISLLNTGVISFNKASSVYSVCTNKTHADTSVLLII